jgi:hypothetical protein
MGYLLATGGCVACGKLISYNPDRVPSITVNGSRQAICRGCFEKWNKIHRTSKGLDPVKLNPDAYEPLKEA